MGICFEVSSLLGQPDFEHPRFTARVKEAVLAERREVLERICQHFNWDQVPWTEPALQRGRESYCCGWSSYNCLRAIATAIELGDYSSNAPKLTNTKVKRFIHLTDREDSQYTAMYLPVDFQEPFQIKTTVWETCTIGSSVRLLQELDELAPLVIEEGVRKDRVLTRETEKIWPSVCAFQAIFKSYVQESLDLHLPLLIQW